MGIAIRTEFISKGEKDVSRSHGLWLTGSFSSRYSSSADSTAVIIIGSSPSFPDEEDVTRERVFVKMEGRWGVREEGVTGEDRISRRLLSDT